MPVNDGSTPAPAPSVPVAASAAQQQHSQPRAQQAMNPPETAFQQPAQQAFQQPAFGGARSWINNPNSLGRAPISRGIGAEQLSKIKAEFTALLEASSSQFNNADWTLQLESIDRGTTELRYAVLLLILRPKREMTNFISHYSLILEATGDTIAPVFEQVGGMNIAVNRTAAAAYDKVHCDVVNARINSLFPNAVAIDGTAMIVPKSFDANDKTQILNLLTHALLVCYNTLLPHSPDAPNINIADARNVPLTVDHVFSKHPSVGPDGVPIRNDITIVLSEKSNARISNSSRATVNNADQDKTISTVRGFIDLMYAPVEQQGFQFGFNPASQLPPTVRYAANFVATSFENNYANSVSAQLLSLATLATLNDRKAWQLTYSKHAGAGIRKNDPTDIGAIGLECGSDIARLRNPGQPIVANARIDTAAVDFDDSQLAMLLALTMHPGLAISIDVPNCGPTTSYLGVFAIAAFNNADGLAARQYIYDSANAMTGGAFSRYLQSPNELFAMPGQPVHLGYYTDEQGIRRDIRDCDYLGVLNITGDRSLDALKEFSNSFLNVNENIEARKAKRRDILLNIFPSAEFTGEATRVTLSAKAMDALAASYAEAGLSMNLSNTRILNAMNTSRGVASMSSALYQGNAAFINHGGYVNNQGAGMHPVFNGAWSTGA